jgi:hypothetical protein
VSLILGSSRDAYASSSYLVMSLWFNRQRPPRFSAFAVSEEAGCGRVRPVVIRDDDARLRGCGHRISASNLRHSAVF